MTPNEARRMVMFHPGLQQCLDKGILKIDKCGERDGHTYINLAIGSEEVLATVRHCLGAFFPDAAENWEWYLNAPDFADGRMPTLSLFDPVRPPRPQPAWWVRTWQKLIRWPVNRRR
jgi:hypothetical protein